jgi:demethylmenaquinone methyltransferase / 2-methoxy-6-polyprenyl-1,4-benzoquinol methylase
MTHSLTTDPAQPAPLLKGAAVCAMFNRIAGTYDLLNDCISLGMHRRWKRRAVTCLKLKPGDRVLDVCSGTGDFIGYLYPRVGEHGEIVALDFSEDMLAVARQRFASLPGKLSLVQGDAMALPFEDGTFDGAIVGFGLRNVEDIRQAVAEMVRVIKPGGWVVNLDTSPTPVLPGFWLYFSWVMPLIGRLFSKDREAYQYLCQSTRHFLAPAELTRLFEGAGLVNVHGETLAFGTVGLQEGQKPL